MNQQPVVGIVGGGVSGLATAYYLRQRLPAARIHLWEASSRLGGALYTQWIDGYCVEGGADMFITNVPWAVELCRRLDVELVGTNPEHRGAFVVHRGRVVPIPEGFAVMMPTRLWPLLTTPLLSWRGKLRLLAEPLVPPRWDRRDESLADFAVRRMGREAFEHLVQPLVAGIYAADARRLSMQAALGRFVQMERRYGSLGAAWWHSRTGPSRSRANGSGSGARYGLFVAPRQGMEQLVHRLAEQLPQDAIHRQSPVAEVKRCGKGWRVLCQTGNQASPTATEVDALVLAVPAHRAAGLLRHHDAELAGLLDRIPYGSAAVVCFAVRLEQLPEPPRGFGFVVPEVEQRQVLAVSFSSVKFPHRAPPGGLLVRVFIGGERLQPLLEHSDERLQQIAWDEVSQLCGWSAKPLWHRVFRWPRAMAQYHVGHLELVRQIRHRLKAQPRLALVGNAYDGVGVPFCIRGAQQAAAQLAQELAAAPK